MISCARATRGLRRLSLDTRSGRPSSPLSRERRKSNGWSMHAVETTPAASLDTGKKQKNRSSDARSEGQSGGSLERLMQGPVRRMRWTRAMGD